MRPRRISDGSTFEPAVLKVVQTAFDQAWVAIADKFSADEAVVARDQLADAVMNVARENSVDVIMLRDATLRVMMQHYPSRFGLTDAEQGTKRG